MPVAQSKFARRDLPHYSPNDAPYFITFNLEGCIPRQKLEELRQGKGKFIDFDRLLDWSESGIHWLRDPQLARIVYDKLLWLKGEAHALHAFTVMSNHVHLLTTLKEDQSLSSVMQLIKGSTSFQCNKLLGRRGTFWQSERYDRVLRRGEYWPVLRYILNNPVKAGVVKHWREHPWTYLNEELHPDFDMREDSAG